MNPQETPLDIYHHDLLGMRTSDWHMADRPELEHDPEPVRLNQKERFITLILCLGFLYAVGLGVWKVQRAVIQTNMAKARSVISTPDYQGNVALEKNDFPEEYIVLPVAEFYANHPDNFGNRPFPQSAFSEINEDLAKFLDHSESMKTWVYPPPNWGLLNYVPPGQFFWGGGCLIYF